MEKFARAVRGHWAIENSLHWVLDVQCGEDRSRARRGHAAANLATLRRLALNLLKADRTKKRGIKGKQLNASWNHSYSCVYWPFDASALGKFATIRVKHFRTLPPPSLAIHCIDTTAREISAAASQAWIPVGPSARLPPEYISS